MPDLPRLAVTLGEPAGIGPELAVHLATLPLAADLVVIGDGNLLKATAERMAAPLTIHRHDAGDTLTERPPNSVRLCGQSLPQPVIAGRLDPRNSATVVDWLATAADGCRDGHFDAVLTLPVHKGVINDAGIAFTGHTEFFADRASSDVLMLLVGDDAVLGPDARIRVALATTHLPLRQVADTITVDLLCTRLRLLDAGLRRDLGIGQPRIAVLGLNPHAGEGGHMGREEIDVIDQAVLMLRAEGLDLHGPLPADTAFVAGKRSRFDAYFAMFHDQGLPVLKALAFGGGVNVTLGLPFVRTSVDHGVALDLAGTGRADAGSAAAAAELALGMVRARHSS